MYDFVGPIRLAQWWAWWVLFLVFSILFLSIASFFCIHYIFCHSEESYFLDDEYDEPGSDSVSSGTYYFRAFSLRFEKLVGSVSVLGYDVFVTIGAESKADIFLRLQFSYLQESSPKVVNSLKRFDAQIPYIFQIRK